MDNYNRYQHYLTRYKSIDLHGSGSHEPPSRDKVLGALYGNCVGDALGTRYEFLSNQDATSAVLEDVSKHTKLPILGHGPFEVEAGQISDDGEMTLSLLRSLAESREYLQEDVARLYIEWFNTKPVDIGNTIKRALFTRQPSKTNVDMVNNSNELNCTSLSNGVLMRVAPLGVLATKIRSSQLKDIVEQECDLTHPNKIIKDAVFIYCLTIKYCLRGFDKRSIYKELLRKVSEPRVRIIIKDAFDTSSPTYLISDNKEQYACPDSKRFQGYFGIALQLSLYELYNGTDFNSSMINILKRGGDTDTNCAIAGGILGAYYGLASIDKDWVTQVKNTNIERVKKHPNLSPAVIDSLVDKIIRFDD